MKRFASAVTLFVLGLSLGACGGSTPSSSSTTGNDTTTTGTSTKTTHTDWPGPPQPSSDGSIDTAGFDEWAEQNVPSTKQVPRELALEFLRLPGKPEVSVTNRTGGATVVVLRENLEDDSVEAIRYELGFALVTGGKWRLLTAKAAYKCHRGRGHQDFSIVLCS